MTIKRASSICGIGDAINQRAFLVTYCQQKNIPHSQISVYTEKYWWAFEGLGFKRGLVRKYFGGLVAYKNFGFYDKPKLYDDKELDVCISKNMGVSYRFENCVLFPKYEAPKIKLPEKYITFNTGFGNLSGIVGNKEYVCLKSWPTKYWVEFVKKIGIPCIQIGSGPSCEIIQGTALNLVDRLSIQESMEVMRMGLFHVDMEGGLPILNQHLGKKSVVLFGATAIENQGREFNLNLRSYSCDPCYEWGNNRMKKLYALKKGLVCGMRCMKDLTPDYVVDKIKSKGWISGPQYVEKKYIIYDGGKDELQ